MKNIIAKVIAPLALTAGLVMIPAAAAHATDYSVNMDQTCQIQYGIGYQSILLDSSNAYSWRCWVAPWGVRKNVSVQAYCSYFGLGTAVILDSSNPYSWRCRT